MQDSNLTWNTNNLDNVKGVPDFTSCFEETVLAWIPTVFLIFFLPFELYSALNPSFKPGTSIKEKRQLLWSPLFIMKTLISICLIITQFLLITHHTALRDENDTIYDIEKYTPIIRFITFVSLYPLKTSSKQVSNNRRNIFVLIPNSGTGNICFPPE